jgi:hypothetical protein
MKLIFWQEQRFTLNSSMATAPFLTCHASSRHLPADIVWLVSGRATLPRAHAARAQCLCHSSEAAHQGERAKRNVKRDDSPRSQGRSKLSKGQKTRNG